MKKKSYFRTIESAALCGAPARGLQFVTVQSRHLKRRGDLTLYVPHGHSVSAPLPLVILLHGVYGSHWAWALQGEAPKTAQKLIDQKRVAPFILAMPSDGLWGDGSSYLNHPGGDFEKWIMKDVPQAVHEITAQIDPHAKMAIGGLSMGGFGAMHLGAKHPNRFYAISGLSSITEFGQMKKFTKTPLSEYHLTKKEGSVFHQIKTRYKKIPPLRFDCGTEDLLIHENRELHRLLEKAKIPHDYQEFPGKHEWVYWKKHLEKTFLFFNRNRIL